MPLKTTPSQDIHRDFAALGDAHDPTGRCFYFTAETFLKEFGGEVQKLPRPDYEHRIFRDGFSGHYLVVCPTAEGKWWGNHAAVFERIR